MLRLWLTSVGVGIIAAWFAGLNPLSPYLYECIVLGGLTYAGGMLMLAFGAIGSRVLVLMAVGAIPWAMGYAEHTLTRDVTPRNRFHRYAEDAPVALATWVEGGRLHGRITNKHPRDWLHIALVMCRPTYANGQASKTQLRISMSADAWLGPGEATEARLIVSDGLGWQPGMAIEKTHCWVSSADMYEAAARVPAFSYAKDAENRYIFAVTNTRMDAALTRVSFNCWVTFAGRRSKIDLNMLPLYDDGTTYSAKPGKTITLYSPILFAARQLSDCKCYDVSWE
jgi:hypothetical protein